MEDEERINVLSKTEVFVNLDAPPELPFDGATIESNTSSTCGIGSGWVRVEKRRDRLYVGGRKVILYLFKQQKGKKMTSGFELDKVFSGKPVLHPNILDALLEHPDFIPEGWKEDNNGNIRHISFWAVIFCDSIGLLYVRCLCFRGGEWGCDGRWLVRDWGDRNPAALLES